MLLRELFLNMMSNSDKMSRITAKVSRNSSKIQGGVAMYLKPAFLLSTQGFVPSSTSSQYSSRHVYFLQQGATVLTVLYNLGVREEQGEEVWASARKTDIGALPKKQAWDLWRWVWWIRLQICVFLPTVGGESAIFHQTQHQKSHPC